MREKTADQLAEALTQTLEATGFSATEVVEILMEKKVPAKYKPFLKIGYKAGFKRLLEREPEPDRNGLAQALAALEAMRTAPHKMRSLMKKRLKELPHPPGGPPRKIKSEEEKTVCAEIQALRGQYDTREAIRQVARKRGVSDRTIYRIWGKYYPKKKKLTPPSTK